MKTAIVKPTEDLKRIVLLTSQFSDEIQIQSLDEIMKDRKIEVIITEKNDLSSPDVIQMRDQFSNHKILILADSVDAFFQKTCLAHDVLLIPKSLSEKERLKLIQKSWFGLEDQTEFHNVVAIHGTHRQVGVTQIALSLGLKLGDFNLKTLVIGLNPYNPGEIHNVEAPYSFEQIYDLVENNVITDGESLTPYLLKQNSFYYLVGNRDYYKALMFEKKPIERLIHIAKDHFDIVLLDIGSFYDGHLPLTGLECSNTHILVSSQESISFSDYKRWKEQVLVRFSFHPKSIYQVVNKMASRAIITSKQLRDAHNIDILAQIPYFPEANDAEIEQGILYQADYRPFNKIIEGIARAIQEEILEGINTPKRSLLNFFKRES